MGFLLSIKLTIALLLVYVLSLFKVVSPKKDWVAATKENLPLQMDGNVNCKARIQNE